MLLEKREVNTGRQIEADIAKAVCIVGMILVHCFEQITPDAAGGMGLRYIVVTVLDCIFGAGTFMFCMGMGISYSDPTPKKLIRRGAWLLMVAYLLNIVRGVLPLLAVAAVSGNTACLSRIPRELINLDILNFAGLAMILFGLLMMTKRPKLWLVVTAAATSVTGSLIRTFDMGGFYRNQLVGLFLGTAETGKDTVAFFPLFNWFIFVVAGYLYGQFLKHCSDKAALYKRLSPAMWAIILVYMVVAIPRGLGMMGEDMNKYYHLTTIESLVCVAAALGVFGGYYALAQVLPKWLTDFFSLTSQNINSIYCIHWTILCWVWFPFRFGMGIGTMPNWFVLLFGFTLFAVSSLAANMYSNMKKKARKEGKL